MIALLLLYLFLCFIAAQATIATDLMFHVHKDGYTKPFDTYGKILFFPYGITLVLLRAVLFIVSKKGFWVKE